MPVLRSISASLLISFSIVGVFLESSANAQTGMDIVFANDFEASEVCFNEGDFTCSAIGSAGAYLAGVSTGDVDNDGFLDIVFASYGDPNPICFGDGRGDFDCTAISPASSPTIGIELGDVNGDGFLDVVTAERNFQSQVCLGDGTGGFSCAPIYTFALDDLNVALGDINNDGNLDAVFAGTIDSLCLGDGGGGFLCSLIDQRGTSGDVALGDVNNDGNFDAIFATVDSFGGGLSNDVCLGDGLGGFSCDPIVQTPEFETTCVGVGDVDLDGNLDLIFGNWTEPNRVCLGDGTGTSSSWSCSDLNSDRDDTTDVAVGDVDGDGRLDAVFSNQYSQTNQVCYGDGSGGFSCADVGDGTSSANGVALGEFGRITQQVPGIPDLSWFGLLILVSGVLLAGICRLRAK